MHDVNNRSRVDVAAVTHDARTLLGLFGEVLCAMGRAEHVRTLPLVGDATREHSDDSSVLAASIGFHLLSLVEHKAATRHRCDAERLGHVESGLWRSTLTALAGTRPELLASVDVEPVFTAHPTEARRTSVLEQYHALYALLPDERPLSELSAREREAVRVAMERLLRSGEVRLRKPELRDERSVVVHNLVTVMPAALEELETRLVEAWVDASLPPLPDSARPRVRFASWVGGDRDGHPLVTTEVTREALLGYRQAALDHHHQALARLGA
jgi:phosphoenolpyruvate carboxylase